jgi:hypothetical protein
MAAAPASGGTNWASIGAGVGGAIAGIAGNLFGSSSANKGIKKQIKYLKEAEQRAYAERERGRVAALAAIEPYRNDMGAREMIGRAMTSRPEMLTPGQQIALEDATRDVTAGIAASGMRGAGRGGQALIADAQRRIRADAYGQNQARADLASRDLAAQGESAATNAANIETGASGASASDIIRTGAAIGGAQGAMGENTGNAIVGSANLAGQTLGAIAALSNRDGKNLKSYPTLAYQV